MTWLIWALILLAQNFAFTYVSRARNSGSLWRHVKAAVFSNSIWFVSQVIIVSKLFDYLTGKYGIPLMIFTGAFYTAFTLGGSVLAHHFALKTEKGKDAVGANKRYAQITVEEWEEVKQVVYAAGYSCE